MKQVLGQIDCPTCGTKGGMRVTPDRNGDPFGFCEATCGQQLRIGGNPARVKAFSNRYPWAAPAPAPAPAQAPKPATPAPAPAPRKASAGPFDFLLNPAP